MDNGALKEGLRNASLPEIAAVITEDWGKVNFAAAPYVEAMFSINSVDDYYGADYGRWIVVYFLSNASTWRGPVARMVKAELKEVCDDGEDIVMMIPHAVCQQCNGSGTLADAAIVLVTTDGVTAPLGH